MIRFGGKWIPGLAVMSLLMLSAARADVLTGTNGERFVGQVIEENTNTVIFESELGGRMTLPRDRVRSIEKSAAPKISDTAAPSLAVTNPPISGSASNLLWRPPAVGQGGSDWIQLKSGEWLKGQIKYIQQKEIEFDSDELDELTIDLKDVRQLYTAQPMLSRFYGGEQVYGFVVISNDVVSVSGAKDFTMHRDDLNGITPGGQRELNYWSGFLNTAVSLQSGNTKQTTITTSAELARRTPGTQLLLDYLGNYSEVNSDQSANNQRVNLNYDIRLNRDWFVRAVQLEYYRDPLANISSRLTGGSGAGYYIFDRDNLEWNVAAGPSYQYTKFDTVETGQDDTAKTVAGTFQSYFKVDITRRLKFIDTLNSTVTKEDAGRYTHHSVTTLEFEIKRHLDLDVSYIWDYVQNPQAKSDGTIPEKSDTYLTVGLGVRF